MAEGVACARDSLVETLAIAQDQAAEKGHPEDEGDAAHTRLMPHRAEILTRSDDDVSLVNEATRIGAFTEKGYFSQADPNGLKRNRLLRQEETLVCVADLRPLKRRLKSYDVTKREGFADFIWNTDWQAQLDEEREAEERAIREKEEKKRESSGFLSLSRAADLNDMSVDLSDRLRRKTEGPKSSLVATNAAQQYVPPTQKEASEWARSTRFATRAFALDLDAEGQNAAERDAELYRRENLEILVWNACLIGACFTATYGFYTQDVALSYLTGACGGLIYLRLLKKGVESIGGTNRISSLAAQPRLLVPVILVMAFNRWNALAGDRVGVHLELLPMLTGFFTYKAAIVGRQSLLLFQEIVAEITGESKK